MAPRLLEILFPLSARLCPEKDDFTAERGEGVRPKAFLASCQMSNPVSWGNRVWISIRTLATVSQMASTRNTARSG